MKARSFAVATALAAVPGAIAAQNATTPATPSAVMKTYCVSCHSGPSPNGGVSLDRIDADSPAKDVEAWERVVRQLRARAMPVMGAARPDNTTYDSIISALITGFFSAWLSLGDLTTMKSDRGRFPEFDDELRAAMQRETELFIASQLRDDSNPLDLWTANYTFLNERLARHYGLPGITGPGYRRVMWPGSERAGLLGQGSILTLTSYLYNAYPVDVPTTSPAQRGKWILTRALGVNPPATVQNVPSADFPFVKHTPLVAQSRTFPATPCQACHRAFFPLSYGLEHFDVLGRWRADYGPGAINASGSLVDGTMFNGPVELRRALLDRSDAFLNLLAEKLLAYADGGPSAIDKLTPATRMPVVRSVLRESKVQNYSWSSLIAAIAKAPSEGRQAKPECRTFRSPVTEFPVISATFSWRSE